LIAARPAGRRGRRRFFISSTALVLTALVLAAVVELVVRASWDPARGRPGFLVADPVRLEKLAPNYDGWFAGVPVRTNALGFRDDREYDLAKPRGAFRIVVLGDSVTFGHGSIFEHTYPRLLERRLRAWKPGVDWQVWNLGVPGYNTSQELAYLLEIGAAYRPDLVIVGFYANDVVDNRSVAAPTRRAVAAAAVKTWFKRHTYSFEWYKRTLLTVQYRLGTSATEREVLENLAAQDRLLVKPAQVAALAEQQLTSPTPLSASDIAAARCSDQPIAMLQKILQTPGLEAWKDAVRRLQQLGRDGTYRIVFFINSAPTPCEAGDVFDARTSKPVDDYFLQMLQSDATPAMSSHDAFIRYRPSQMPEAWGHSIGNSNALKANVLFEFLRDGILKD
jgi:lysophospholipase L1-like esterase